jgi:hypothetical protein
MWSQITFLLSIRRSGSQQIDFKVSSLWRLRKKNILETMLISEIDRVNFNNKYFLKSKQTFVQILD